MAQLLYSRQEGVSTGYLKQVMGRKLRSVGSLRKGENIRDIPHGGRARIAYDLGAWFIAFLISRSSEDAYRVKFFKLLEKRGFEAACRDSFGWASHALLDDFHENFRSLELPQQLKIIP